MILFTGKLNSKDSTQNLPNDLRDIVSEWIETKSISIQTSGSTGEPKTIVIPKNVVLWSVKQSKKALGLTDEEVVLLCIPFSKIGGRMLLLRSLINGWKIQVQEATANPLLDLPDNHKFTFVSLVPYQLASILAHESSTAKLKRFKTVLIGGAALSGALEQETQSFLKKSKTNVYHSYGMTETASHVALRNMRLMKPNNFKLLDGVKVHLTKSGCMRFDFEEVDWVVKTKDVGRIHQRTIEFLSRKDEVVNSGGIKLHIHDIRFTIDEMLEDHQLLVRFFLWKQPDDALGEKLVMVGLSNPHQGRVEEILKESLPKYDVPKVFYWTDYFDRKESGKIDRQKTLNRLIEVSG